MEPNLTATPTSPAKWGFEITPSDTATLPKPTRSVRAGGAGVVKWVNEYGDTQHTTFEAGERVAINAIQILATGTTATGIEALA